VRLLAVDTSTLTGAVALLDRGRAVGESRLSLAVTHGERLLSTVDALLRAARWQLADVDAFAVAIGPGSFTGLRIGVSTVKSLAFATARPVAGVPTLEGLAWALPYCAYAVCPVLDAKKGEVYAALYRTIDGEPATLRSACAIAPDALVEAVAGDTPGPVVFVGDGVAAIEAAALRVLGSRARFAPAGLRLTSAVAVGELGARALARGEAADVEALVPLYLRPSEAELARERGVGAARAG